jgi:succinate dehydrogenase/fumarate reductase cytochrome b subunit
MANTDRNYNLPSGEFHHFRYEGNTALYAIVRFFGWFGTPENYQPVKTVSGYILQPIGLVIGSRLLVCGVVGLLFCTGFAGIRNLLWEKQVLIGKTSTRENPIVTTPRTCYTVKKGIPAVFMTNSLLSRVSPDHGELLINRGPNEERFDSWAAMIEAQTEDDGRRELSTTPAGHAKKFCFQ